MALVMDYNQAKAMMVLCQLGGEETGWVFADLTEEGITVSEGEQEQNNNEGNESGDGYEGGGEIEVDEDINVGGDNGGDGDPFIVWNSQSSQTPLVDNSMLFSHTHTSSDIIPITGHIHTTHHS